MIRPSLVIVACLLAGATVTACDFVPSTSSPSSPGTGAASARADNSSSKTVKSGHLTEIFDGPLPVKMPEADAVTGWRQALVAWNVAEQQRNLTSAVKRDVAGDALFNLKRAIAALKSENAVPAGADRMFKTEVVSATTAEAQITTCDDGRKDTNMNVATGRIGPAPSTLSTQYAFETWNLVRKNDHWIIESFTLVAPPSPTAHQCLP